MKNYLPTPEPETKFTAVPNLLFLLAMALFLGTAACTQTENTNRDGDVVALSDESEAGDETANTENGEYDNENIAGETGRSQVEWNNLDFNVMQDRYNEINDRDISVGTNQQVAVYSLNEPVLFDKQGNELRSGAEQKLQQIASSVNQRYPNAHIRIYGYGEQEGATSNTSDRDLAQKRAAAVQNWLTSNGNISASRISVHTSGGTQPGMVNNQQTTTGTNQTAANQDRKVSIVVYRGDNSGSANATNAANTSAANNTNSGHQPASTPGQTTR